MNTDANVNNKQVNPTKKSKKNTDECIELKNIKYQTMLINNNSNNIKKSSTNINNLDNFLNQEKQKHINQPWNKLGDGSKLKKIQDFVNDYGIKNKLNDGEKIKLYKYLKRCLERKKLQRVKDVQYSTDQGKIITIPGLLFNIKNNKFTLKNIDKKGSTLKSLAPKKRRKKNKDKKKETTDDSNKD